jgi:hypothetical protein
MLSKSDPVPTKMKAVKVLKIIGVLSAWFIPPMCSDNGLSGSLPPFESLSSANLPRHNAPSLLLAGLA